MCRYCEPGSVEDLCRDCTNRYQRVLRYANQIVNTTIEVDRLAILSKLLDDMADYERLEAAGCYIPPRVIKIMAQYRGVERPKKVCRYCGNEIAGNQHSMHMCKDCFNFHTMLKHRYAQYSLHKHGNWPTTEGRRKQAIRNKERYKEMLRELRRREEAGLALAPSAEICLIDDSDLLDE